MSSGGVNLGSTGSIGRSGSNLNVNIYDDPTARNIPHSVINFQTIIVATNFYGSGQNVVMGVYNWGFRNSSGTPAQTHTTNTVNFSTIRQSSLNILRKDYPSYNLNQ
jgi:hypothetical protein